MAFSHLVKARLKRCGIVFLVLLSDLAGMAATILQPYHTGIGGTYTTKSYFSAAERSLPPPNLAEDTSLAMILYS
jgi:hypothetical protein